jgi:hypothetical protein
MAVSGRSAAPIPHRCSCFSALDSQAQNHKYGCCRTRVCCCLSLCAASLVLCASSCVLQVEAYMSQQGSGGYTRNTECPVGLPPRAPCFDLSSSPRLHFCCCRASLVPPSSVASSGMYAGAPVSLAVDSPRAALLCAGCCMFCVLQVQASVTAGQWGPYPKH